MLSFVVVNQPLKFRFFSKIEQQSHFNISGLQIIHQLRYMRLVDCFSSFEFNNHSIVYYQVCSEFPYLITSKIHLNGFLLFNLKTSFF